MARSTRHLGISFCRNRIQAAEVQFGRTPTLFTIAENESSLDLTQAGVHLTGDHPQVLSLVNEISDLIYRNKITAQNISFALPRDSVFIHSLPVDRTLKGASLREHLRWEIHQYFPNVDPKEFIISSQKLSGQSENYLPTFMVGVRRGLVEFLQNTAKKLRLEIRFIDVDQFSSEKALFLNHSEASNGIVSMIGVRYGGIDGSTFENGELFDYRYEQGEFPQNIPEAILNYLSYVKKAHSKSPASIFLTGLNIQEGILRIIRQNTKIGAMLCNPFLKLPVAKKIFHAFMHESSRFTAAVGLALRTD